MLLIITFAIYTVNTDGLCFHCFHSFSFNCLFHLSWSLCGSSELYLIHFALMLLRTVKCQFDMDFAKSKPNCKFSFILV